MARFNPNAIGIRLEGLSTAISYALVAVAALVGWLVGVVHGAIVVGVLKRRG